MSRHQDRQYRLYESVRQRLFGLVLTARRDRLTQAAYLDAREEIFASPDAAKLTGDRRQALRAYERGMSNLLSQDFRYVKRFTGEPETGTDATWDDLPEDLRRALRTGCREVESCLAWDSKGEHPWGTWAPC